MTTVAPAAANTAPRVNVRNRDVALSLLSGVLGSSVGDIGRSTSAGGTPLSHHRRIDTVAVPAVGLL